jgi:hypothetical protein
MAETHAVSGLKAKEEKIKKRILGLRKEIKGCQDDLEAIRKALRIFGESCALEVPDYSEGER